MGEPFVYLSRVENFSSGHVLNNPDLSLEENKLIYGKCNNIHGHNYMLTVTLRGPIDKRTGMLMNLTDLKKIIHDCVISKLDHKNLDADVEYFSDVPSTCENMVVFIWNQLKPSLGGLLYKVKLDETVNNSVTYKGELH